MAPWIIWESPWRRQSLNNCQGAWLAAPGSAFRPDGMIFGYKVEAIFLSGLKGDLSRMVRKVARAPERFAQ